MIYRHSIFAFLGCFFATMVIVAFFIFFSLYKQVTIMSSLISVNQKGIYKIYVYLDKPLPGSDVISISNCLKKTSGDVKAVIYVLPPNFSNNNAFSLGVIGKINDICDNEELNKWENIVWKDAGIEFGGGNYFFKKELLPKFK
jgi:hypothetical protein